MLVISLTWKQLFTLDLLFFGKKNLGRSTDRTPAAATPCYYTASMRQKGLEKSMEKHQEPTKAHLTKILPRNFKKGGRFFFNESVFKDSKIGGKSLWKNSGACPRSMSKFCHPWAPHLRQSRHETEVDLRWGRHWNETSGWLWEIQMKTEVSRWTWCQPRNVYYICYVMSRIWTWS